MTASTDRWYLLAHQVLQAIEVGYEARGLVLPDYRVVVPTPVPPSMCPMVAVGLGSTAGTTGNVAGSAITSVGAGGLAGAAMRTATYTVTVLRDVPGLNDRAGYARPDTPPSPESQDAAARLLMGDHHALVESLADAYQDAALLVGCGSLAMGTFTSLQSPDGGIAGLRATLLLGRV